MKRLFVIFLFIALSFEAVGAAGSVSGKISSIHIKETGYVLIALQASHANPTSCLQDKWIAIANDHIAKKEMLSVVLTAQVTNKTTAFWVTDCYENYGTSYPLAITTSINEQ